MQEVISTIIYSTIGIILMMFGVLLIDLIIPCHFQTEIKKRNTAVGYITAGGAIAVGIVLKSAISSPPVEAVSKTFIEGIGSTLLYFAIGIIMCGIGYFIMKIFNRKYDLDKEIGDGNPAAGLMVMGVFIGLAIVISGAVY